MGARIAIDVGPLVGPRSGIGVAVAELLRALRVDEHAPDLVPYVLSFRAPLPPDTTRLWFPAALAQRAWSIAPFPRVDRVLGRPDVIHGTNYVVPPARATRLVTVYDCWFLEHPEGVHADVARAGAVLRRSIRTGAVVHCSSQATADALAALMAPERMEVIPLGHVPLAPVPNRPAPRLVFLAGRPFVLAIGTLERRKNLTTLVRAFARAAHAERELELVIAGGPGNDSVAVEREISALPEAFRRRVHVVGRIDEADKSWLVHHARVLAYPSLDEGFGFPLLEAMGAGTPVVASTAGSIPEVAGDAAILHEPTDDEALAAALVLLHTDEALRDGLVERGRRNVTRYSWRTTASRLIALYDALAMDRPR